MKRIASCILLILGLIFGASISVAQSTPGSIEHWHTAGVGLSTPMGFNVGASYSVVVKGPLFVQASVTASKDIYITKHSAFTMGPAAGLRYYTDVALMSVSVGPTLSWGTRGADLPAPFSSYETASVNFIGQVLFREINMGFEIYSNVNPVRNVSGMRLIYRLGQFH